MPASLIQFDPQHDPAPPPSPCIGVCVLQVSTGLCDGCQRDIDEIMGWGQATESQKRAIWRQICARRALS